VKRIIRSAASWLTFFAILVAVSACQQKTSVPAVADESQATPPDWSGWWGLEWPAPTEFAMQPPPWKPGREATFGVPRPGDSDAARNRYCRPSQFPGHSGGFVESIEFLFTPGRVTITSESGLIRRIYTDGTGMPTDVDDSNTGMSVGHWEGGVLVVETIGISPKVRYPGNFEGAVLIGRNVRVSERISLQPRDTLQFEIVTVAPDVLTAPDRRTRVYNKVPKRYGREVTFCTDFDRAIDPATGRQRFDMTPPEDLPPPPPR
jgi:hypothetical protein